ncbi:nuclease [Rhizobium beringeri]
MKKFRTQMEGAAVATLLSIAAASPTDARSPTAIVSISVHATYCENSACEPVTLQISNGDSFVVNRWGNHRETIRIANIDAPNDRARCIGEKDSAERATGQAWPAPERFDLHDGPRRHGSSQQFDGIRSVDRHDLGHELVRERLTWPWEPKHRFWC